MALLVPVKYWEGHKCPPRLVHPETATQVRQLTCTGKEQPSSLVKWTQEVRAVSVACHHMVEKHAHAACFWKDTKIEEAVHYLTCLKNR